MSGVLIFIKKDLSRTLSNTGGPGHGLVPSESKHKHEPKLTKTYVALWRLLGTVS